MSVDVSLSKLLEITNKNCTFTINWHGYDRFRKWKRYKISERRYEKILKGEVLWTVCRCGFQYLNLLCSSLRLGKKANYFDF